MHRIVPCWILVFLFPNKHLVVMEIIFPVKSYWRVFARLRSLTSMPNIGFVPIQDLNVSYTLHPTIGFLSTCMSKTYLDQSRLDRCNNLVIHPNPSGNLLSLFCGVFNVALNPHIQIVA